MRVSIWQQFSSNHSTTFTIVGVFENRDQAQKAIAELRQILETIEKWHLENPEKSEAWYQASQNAGWVDTPSDIELSLGEQYDIRWRDGIDWSEQANISIVMDHIVLLKPKHQTHSGPHPFDQLIERLGGIGMMVGDDMSNIFGEIMFEVSCEAPDETTADVIEREQLSRDKKVARFKTHLRFEWEYEGIGFDLLEFIPYLKSHNCRQISYFLQGKNYVATRRIFLDDAEKG